MADQTVTLRIHADAKGLITGVELAKRETRSLGDEGERAGRKLGGGMAAARAELERTGHLVNLMKGFVLGLGAAVASIQTLKALGGMADTWSDLTARVRLSIKEHESASDVMARLADISRQTYSSMELTAESYTRNATTLNALNKSTAQQLDYAQALNNALVVSGAKQERAVMVQNSLAKAMAEGALRGEEMNNVLSYGSRIAELLAEELGVNVTELRALSAEGKITGDVIFNSLVKNMQTLTDEAESMPATIEDAFVLLRNSVLQAVGVWDQQNKISETFAEKLITIADHMGEVMRAAGLLAQVLLTVYGTRLLMSAAAYTTELTRQIVLHLAAGSAAREMGIKVDQSISASIKKIGLLNLAIGTVGAAIAGWQIGTYLREEFVEVERFGIAMVAGLLKAWERLKVFGVGAWETIKAAALGAVEAVRKAAADVVGALAKVNEATDPFGIKSGITDRLRELETQLRPTATSSESLAEIWKRLRAELEQSELAIDEQMFALWESAGAAKGAKDETEELDETLTNFNATLDTTTGELVDLYTEMHQVVDATDDVDAMLRSLTRTLADDATRAQMDYQDNLAAILDLEMQWMALGPLSEEQIAKLNEARALAGQVYRQDMEALNAETVRAAERAAEESTRAWEDFAYGLADAVLDGSRGVKDYFKRLLDDLKRQIISSGLMNIFKSIFNVSGSAGGGFVSQLGAMFGGPTFGTILGAAGGASGGVGSSLLTGLAGAISGGISTGLMSLGGTLAGLGMGGLGGGLAWAGGSVAANGLLGGLGSSFMTGMGNLFGAGGGALMGIGQMIPAIAAIAGVAAAIQKISGGKLFGTSYGFDSAGRTLDFSATGASGQDRVTEVRQRSLFRGRRWRDTFSDLPDDVADSIGEFWDAVTASNIAIAGDAARTVGAQIRQEFDAEGNVTSTLVSVIGRQYRESLEEAMTRIAAENVIANIDAMLGTTVTRTAPGTGPGQTGPGGGRGIDGLLPIDTIIKTTQQVGEAFAIAERWRHDAELLAAGAQFLLAAATDIRRGAGLLGDEGGLTAIADLIEDLATAGESLVDTYTRVATSAALLDQSLALSGVQIDGTREHIVRLATAITDAAGGLEQAQALWSSYFQNFYDAAELAQYNAEQLRTAADAAFAGAGLDITDYLDVGGLAQFRRDFEAAMPTMSAEDIAAWLRAADALAAVTASARAIDAALDDNAWQLHLDGLDDSARAIAELTRHYDDWRESLIAAGATSEQLAAVEDQRAVALERLLAAAEAEYQSQVGNVRDMVDARGMSEFALEMRDIHRWAQQTTDALNAAAVAAGRQYAAEEDLALVHAETAARAAEAIAKLRASAAALVAELFGPAAGSLDDINARIAEIEARSAGSFGAVESGIGNAVDAWIAGIARVQDFLDSILLSAELSTLTPEQMLAEAQGQFDTLLAAARGGDADALSALPDAARTLLELGRDFWSSGDQYQQLFDTTRDALQTVAGMAGPAATGGAPGYTSSGHAGVSGELAELYAQRDALLAEQEAAQRAEMIESLGGMIRELIQATGEPLADVAASIGLNLSELADSLGIDLNNVSVATAAGLVDMARLLGVDVAELAQNVGISLGSLADDQSLLNQALEDKIKDLPAGQRDALQELFDNIVTATNEADANAAIGTMAGYINSLDADIRNELAPFFDDIDPAPVVTELTRLSDLSATASQQLDAAREANQFLRRIAENNYAANEAAGLPAYAAGGWVNGPTTLLAGEAGRELILPNPVSEFFQRVGIPINTGGGGAADAALMRELIAEVRQLRAERLRGDREVAAAAAGAGDKVADKIERQTDADDRRSRELIAATERSNR